MRREELLHQLSTWLQPDQVSDYCPNGLQVEGAPEVQKIVTGVTASQALIDRAIEENADTVIVHHGYFWKGENQAIVGMKKRRIAALLKAEINLIAYHLPLDIHPEFGNNAQLAKLLGAIDISPIPFVSPVGVLVQATLSERPSGFQLAEKIESVLKRKLVASEVNEQPIHRIAICTGGGQGFIEQAAQAGVQAFITGEVSEQTIHVARECGIQFFAAGHHATERYGVKALGEKIAAELNLPVQFIDIDNPA